MQKTSNYGLNKPDGTDTVDISVLNGNMDTIDIKLKNNADDTAVLDKKVSSHLADMTNHTPYAIATGSTNTYVVTLNPVPTAYVDGMSICVKINTTSTGASTLNINELGAKAILDSSGNAIANGGLKANTPYTMRYNGTSFIVQGKGGGGNATASDLCVGKTATVDTGQIIGTNPYGIGLTISDNNLSLLYPISTKIWNNSDIHYASAIAVDTSKNIYVAYSVGSGKSVRKFNSSGVEIWSLTDQGYARAIAVDSSGNVYVGYDTGTKTVRKLDSNGVEIWSNNDVANCSGIAVDDIGFVYAIYENSSGKTLRKLDYNGVEIWSNSELLHPTDVVVDIFGDVNVTYGNSSGKTVRKFNPSGVEMWSNSELPWALSVAVDKSLHMYIGYNSNASKSLRKLNQYGNEIWNINYATDVCSIEVDDSENVYATINNSLNRAGYIKKVDKNGKDFSLIGTNGLASDLKIDDSGVVYVTHNRDSGVTVEKFYGANIYKIIK